MTVGLKYDAGKPDTTLLPPEVLEAFEAGQKHHRAGCTLWHLARWRQSGEISELFGALEDTLGRLGTWGEGWLSIVSVLEYGERKYGRDNWRVLDRAADRYYAAALRHSYASNAAWLDDESGHPHHAHIGACLVFLIWFSLRDQ